MKSPSNYGTIPTLSHAPPTLTSRAVQTQTLIRPWHTFLDPHSLSIPHSYPHSLSRIKTNLYYFRYNYALVLLLILFLTLVYHPLSLIAFLLVFGIWVFVYFFREGPVAVFNRAIDDRVVFCVMGFVTVMVLVFTHVGLNVLVGLVIAVFVIGLHAGFRDEEDLFVDEDEDGLVSFSRG